MKPSDERIEDLLKLSVLRKRKGLPTYGIMTNAEIIEIITEIQEARARFARQSELKDILFDVQGPLFARLKVNAKAHGRLIFEANKENGDAG